MAWRRTRRTPPGCSSIRLTRSTRRTWHARDGDGWYGQVTLAGDAVDVNRPSEEQRAVAPVRLLRVECP